MILENNQAASAIAVAHSDILQHLALLFTSSRFLPHGTHEHPIGPAMIPIIVMDAFCQATPQGHSVRLLHQLVLMQQLAWWASLSTPGLGEAWLHQLLRDTERRISSKQ